MTTDHDPPLERHESEAIGAEAERGRDADRELARRLDRPGPGDSPVGGRALDALHRRDGRGEPPREVIEAAKAHDERALTEVIEAYTPRIAALARRYQRPEVERLELIQEGVAGLLEALDRYDPDRGTPFWAYARPTVQRSMQRLVGELADAVALSGNALRHLSRLRSAQDELMQEEHRLPTWREIAERAGMDPGEAERLLADTSRPRSLQDPIRADDGGIIGLYGDLVDDPRSEDDYDRVLDAVEASELRPLLSVLSPREREILGARFGLLDGQEHGLGEIAERLGIGKRRVKDIERRALAKLRRAAVAAGAAR